MAAKRCRANVGHCRAYNGLRSMSARVTLRVGNYLNLEHRFFSTFIDPPFAIVLLHLLFCCERVCYTLAMPNK